jgi:HK97 family phage major capsid protein
MAETSAEGAFVNPTAGNPGQFLGIRYEEASGLDNAQDIDDTASADNFVAVVGDWRKFVVVDRVGLSVEYIPHLFGGTANYPTGERGWYAFWRSGSDSVADDHFRMYSIPTTA